jgi:hypothetical protein
VIVEEKYCDTQYNLDTCRTGCLDTVIVEFMTYLKNHGFIPTPSFKGKSDKKNITVFYTFPHFDCYTILLFLKPGQMHTLTNLPDSVSFLGGPHKKFRVGGVL